MEANQLYGPISTLLSLKQKVRQERKNQSLYIIDDLKLTENASNIIKIIIDIFSS